MKNILVPTDFSECALNAVKFEAELARKKDATLYMAHIYQRILTSETTFNIKLEIEIIAKEKDNLETYR